MVMSALVAVMVPRLMAVVQVGMMVAVVIVKNLVLLMEKKVDMVFVVAAVSVVAT